MSYAARVIIVGAGFGGLSAARALADVPVDVVIVDRRNHHLFQPLLYQVATAGLSPADIAAPIRSILSDQRNATVVLSEVATINTAERVIADTTGQRLAYDYLILATGARHAYFGHDEWEANAPGLKTIEDATAIRHRLLVAFERAEMTTDEEERQRLLTIVIVGGGPTGVEMAGAVAELAKRALATDFRHIDPRQARIVLVEAGPRILATFPDNLSARAVYALENLGVDVRTEARVTDSDADGVVVNGERIRAGTVIWGAGVQASPVAEWLGVPADHAGRVKVEADFSVTGHPEIFVIGDAAQITDAAGVAVPGVAPAAKQAGAYVAQVIAAQMAQRPAPAPFRYRNWGNLATIGRRAAVADFGWIRISGPIAWWLWGFVHVFFLIGFRNRVAVMLNWLWSFLTYKRGARLITGSPQPQGREAD
ncbi:MAG: NAD(P)/FAD-dependent oxidoreductase [Rhodocyclaceae bacterium]